MIGEAHILDRRRPIQFSLPFGIKTLHDIVALHSGQFLSPSLVQSDCPLFDPFEGILAVLDSPTGPHPVFRGFAWHHILPTVHRLPTEASNLAFRHDHFFPSKMSLQGIAACKWWTAGGGGLHRMIFEPAHVKWHTLGSVAGLQLRIFHLVSVLRHQSRTLEEGLAAHETLWSSQILHELFPPTRFVFSDGWTQLGGLCTKVFGVSQCDVPSISI